MSGEPDARMRRQAIIISAISRVLAKSNPAITLKAKKVELIASAVLSDLDEHDLTARLEIELIELKAKRSQRA